MCSGCQSFGSLVLKLLQSSMLVVSFGIPRVLKILVYFLLVLTLVAIYATSCCNCCFLRGWGCIDFRYASSVAIGTTDCCRHILSVFFIIIVVRNLSYCFRFHTIVTISHLEMLYFEPFGVFYRDFILLTCILRQPVRLVGLVVLFSFRSRISLWAVSVTDP